MLLAIDIGNTNIVVAGYKQQEIVWNFRIPTRSMNSYSEIKEIFDKNFFPRKLNPEQIEGIVYGSVVPSENELYIDFLQKYFPSSKLRIIGSEEVPIPVSIKLPYSVKEIGADLLANMCQAKKLFGHSTLVIDMGTATTCMLLNGEGEYEGGMIAPGIDAWFLGMYQATDQLPRLHINPKEKKAISFTLEDAMNSGVYFGYIGMVKELIARVKKEVSYPLTIVATGGISNLFVKEASLQEIDHWMFDFTIKGMITIYYYNEN